MQTRSSAQKRAHRESEGDKSSQSASQGDKLTQSPPAAKRQKLSASKDKKIDSAQKVQSV
jgi:hypothetical protein